jgi:hypothetical protein
MSAFAPAVDSAAAELLGVDFTCNPSRRKPIVVARGRLAGDRLVVAAVDALPTLGGFEALLRMPGPWLGGFDLPFGLPRAFVDAHALGASGAEVIAAVRRRCATRMAWRAFIDTWGNTQPHGARLLHRRTDAASPVVSTSPMQTRYVPVGLMYYEGVARLVDSGVTIPALGRAGDPRRVALEAYPRRLAHAIVGRRSYKNGDDDERRDARATILVALEGGRERFGFALACDRALRATLVADASGDRLDAVLCVAQAVVASRRARYGVPDDVDPVEGWIAAE